MIRNINELLDAVEHYGFLPFFKNSIKGFSIEEMCPSELWFTDLDGPWEWKGPASKSGRCIYGKFFGGKAGYVSKEWIPDFVNFRRDGYDFDSRCDDGLVYYKDKELYETVAEHEIILSKELKAVHNYVKGGKKGFDTVITRLQMQSYICVADFVYMLDKNHNPYGWGVAQYTTPEHFFGYDYITSAYKTAPEESKQKIFNHLQTLLPNAPETEISKIIRI
jgi:hypothetical protein